MVPSLDTASYCTFTWTLSLTQNVKLNIFKLNDKMHINRPGLERGLFCCNFSFDLKINTNLLSKQCFIQVFGAARDTLCFAIPDPQFPIAKL